MPDNECYCTDEGCEYPGTRQDRNGVWWCDFCHDNGVCTDITGHLSYDPFR